MDLPSLVIGMSISADVDVGLTSVLSLGQWLPLL